MIRLFRMRSGEDVIGDVVSENQEFINVEKPAVLMPMPDGRGGTVQMGMVPWQPFSKSKDFQIPRDWIVTDTEPADDIADGWRSNFGSGIDVPKQSMLLS